MNYISTLAAADCRGGWSGINAALWTGIASNYPSFYVGPIAPDTELLPRLTSKVKRLAGLHGSFFFYSEQRLRAIASAVASESDSNADVDIFHGITPWINVSSQRPYFAYADACFATYCDVYLGGAGKFAADDISRIFEAEAKWLAGAQGICFSSLWGLEEAKTRYGLTGANFAAVGIGGCIGIPESDRYRGGAQFLSIVTDFDRKGGRKAYDIFREIRHEFPDSGLHYVGAAPPAVIQASPGVVYHGSLDKTKPNQLRSLSKLYSEASFLLLPTRGDTTPVIIAEAGFFGCPTAATNAFGIPEMIVDDVTGLLYDAVSDAGSIATRICDLLRSDRRYNSMRRQVRRTAIAELNWDRVLKAIMDLLN